MNTVYEAPDAAAPPRRWCVYAHHDAGGQAAHYVLKALDGIKACGFKTAVVSTSPGLADAGLRAMKERATAVIVRDNVGYDFGSYKCGIRYLRDIDARPVELLITNDSVFGPLTPLSSVLKRAKGYDLYGITDSIEPSYHLQSYFVHYGRRVLQSDAFHHFWDPVEFIGSGDMESKYRIVTQYEIGGSQFFIQQGFKVGAAFAFKSLVQDECRQFIAELDLYRTQPGRPAQAFMLPSNVSHAYWKNLLLRGCPYIKRGLLTLNPYGVDISDWAPVIRRCTRYDVADIISALHAYTGNDEFFFASLHPSAVADRVRADGTAVLPVNPDLAPWRTLCDIPDEREFCFDETYYLAAHLDVRKALEDHAIESALSHFVNWGRREGRRFALRSRSGHLTAYRLPTVSGDPCRWAARLSRDLARKKSRRR